MPQNGLSPTDAMGADQTVTDRKKKNADAQAAFRARRANYIATLEETGAADVYACQSALFANHLATVTNLEAVVIQLQES